MSTPNQASVMPLQCMACGTPAASNVEPSGGLTFKTYGGYGSKLFDSFGDDFLEIYVCDPCLEKVAKQGRVRLGEHERVPEPVAYRPWDPRTDFGSGS